MTYQTHLDHVLLELAIYQQPFVESVHVPFLEKHVFCGTLKNNDNLEDDDDGRLGIWADT